MALLKIMHHQSCKKVAFYMPDIPVGRPIEYFDALNAVAYPIARGKIVECESCGEKVDLDEINRYYEE